MNSNDSDARSCERLHGLIADTLQRCTNLERTVAACLASGLSPDLADAALAASYNSLRAFREHLAQLEARMVVRIDGQPRRAGRPQA